MRSLLIVVSVLGLILLLHVQFPSALDSRDQRFRALYYSLFIVLIGGGSLAARLRGGAITIPTVVRYAGIWLAVILSLVFVYSFRDEFYTSRLVAELLPRKVSIAQGGRMTVRRSDDGHFHVDGEINGVSAAFLIDTGASDIVLSPQDAARAGFDIDTLNYSQATRTANGFGGAAPVKIGNLVIGAITLRDISAVVNRADMEQSLLGMRFLSELHRYGVSGNSLTMEP